jgi:hypothetical protein
LTPVLGEALDCSGVPVDSGVKNMGVEEEEVDPEDILLGIGPRSFDSHQKSLKGKQKLV